MVLVSHGAHPVVATPKRSASNDHRTTLVQWNPGLTICQGSIKIVSLNRDIVVAEFPV